MEQFNKKTEEEKSLFIGLTKITAKDIGLDRNVLRKIGEKSKGEVVPVARIFGQAQSMKSGETDKGEYVKFHGLFIADCYVDKLTYRASQLILPPVANGMLEGAMGMALANTQGEEGKPGYVAVQFAYEIMIKGDPDSVTGYVYSARSLITGDDPLEKLLEKLGDIPDIKLLK